MVGVVVGLCYCFVFFGYVFLGMCIDRIGFIFIVVGCLLFYVVVFLGFVFVFNFWVGF